MLTNDNRLPPSSHEESEDENLFFALKPRQRKAKESRRWESLLKIDIPEFFGGLQPEEFLNWVAAVEEVLDFKEDPKNNCVPFVATQLRGRVVTWWQQMKQTWERQGKSRIAT